jgi:hypothetical protein
MRNAVVISWRIETEDKDGWRRILEEAKVHVPPMTADGCNSMQFDCTNKHTISL